MSEAKRRLYQRMVTEQKEWIKTCGGDLAGYIRNYGAADDPNRTGNGGEAIYKADTARLEQLESRLADLTYAR